MIQQLQHPVVDWYLAFDDLWELMRVNWQTHNPFTQSGMWQAEEHVIKGIVMVVDQPPYRGVILRVDSNGEDNSVVIVTYGPKCGECGYTPYNALWHAGDDSPLIWGASVITDMVENAEDNGVDKRHLDECSHLTYDEDDDDEPSLVAADD